MVILNVTGSEVVGALSIGHIRLAHLHHQCCSVHAQTDVPFVIEGNLLCQAPLKARVGRVLALSKGCARLRMQFGGHCTCVCGCRLLSLQRVSCEPRVGPTARLSVHANGHVPRASQALPSPSTSAWASLARRAGGRPHRATCCRMCGAPDPTRARSTRFSASTWPSPCRPSATPPRTSSRRGPWFQGFRVELHQKTVNTQGTLNTLLGIHLALAMPPICNPHRARRQGAAHGFRGLGLS